MGARPDLRLVRYAIGNALATVGEWGALIGLLVHVFERSGPEAVGIASFTAILPYVVLAPLTARVAQRRRAATVRVVGMMGQAIGFGIAAASVAFDWPIWVGVLGTAIGFTAATALRPAAAVLLPAIVRSFARTDDRQRLGRLRRHGSAVARSPDGDTVPRRPRPGGEPRCVRGGLARGRGVDGAVRPHRSPTGSPRRRTGPARGRAHRPCAASWIRSRTYSWCSGDRRRGRCCSCWPRSS